MPHRKGNPLRVVNDQKGSPTYSADLAAHTRTMIAAGCRGTYHVTNSGSCTWYELASERLGMGRHGEHPDHAGIHIGIPQTGAAPANSVLANAHLKRDGLPAMRPWQAAAREYVEHYLK